MVHYSLLNARSLWSSLAFFVIGDVLIRWFISAGFDWKETVMLIATLLFFLQMKSSKSETEKQENIIRT